MSCVTVTILSTTCARRQHNLRRSNPRGFWRVDRDKEPELRHTVLTLVAFHDLQEKIDAADGDRERGIEAFLAQNDGEGWMLPETLRLADYGLGHDERARQHQPSPAASAPASTTSSLSRAPTSRGANATCTPAICWARTATHYMSST